MIQIIPNWHPIIVHFPIAFATAAVALTAIGKFFKSRPWAGQLLIMGHWMLWGAAITACIAALFGWIASNSVLHDEAGRLAMTLHRSWAISALVALVLLAAWSARPSRSIETTSDGFLLMLATAWLLLAIAVWHGGEVVYRHGLGVMALPNISDGRGALHNNNEYALHFFVKTT